MEIKKLKNALLVILLTLPTTAFALSQCATPNGQDATFTNGLPAVNFGNNKWEQGRLIYNHNYSSQTVTGKITSLEIHSSPITKNVDSYVYRHPSVSCEHLGSYLVTITGNVFITLDQGDGIVPKKRVLAINTADDKCVDPENSMTDLLLQAFNNKNTVSISYDSPDDVVAQSKSCDSDAGTTTLSTSSIPYHPGYVTGISISANLKKLPFPQKQLNHPITLE